MRSGLARKRFNLRRTSSGGDPLLGPGSRRLIVLSHRTLHRAVRQVLPLAVLLRVDTLEPDVHVAWLWVGRLRQVKIPADGQRDVAVQFHLHVIQLAIEIRRRLLRDVGEPRGFCVDLEGSTTAGPPVAVREDEIRPDQADYMAALERWKEGGIAAYKGSGSANDAANFSCRLASQRSSLAKGKKNPTDK